MKKFILFLIIIIVVGCLIPNFNEKQEDTKEDELSEEVIEEEAIVEITIPSYFYENYSQEDLDEEVESLGYVSETLNDDGSVTIVLSEEDYDELLAELKEGLDEQITDLAEDEDNHIYEIEYLEDYTYFKVIVDNALNIESVRLYSPLIFYFGVAFDAYTTNSIDTYAIEYYDLEGDLIATDSFTGTFDDLCEAHQDLF